VAHLVYLHQNFPAQFGHLAAALVRRGHRCTFVSQQPGSGETAGVQRIQYKAVGGATKHTNYFSRTFENTVAHATGIYEALKPLRDTLAPDVIVGHSGYGPTLCLHELFPRAAIVNYFEFFYQPHGGDLAFRPDVPPLEIDQIRARARNAMFLVDLEYGAGAYTPTRFQHGLFPDAHRDRLDVIHDGVPTDFWRRVPGERRLGHRVFAPGTKLLTYVSRGFESMRGFDVFMKVAKRVCAARTDVEVLIVGKDQVCYGGDLQRLGVASFKEWVLAQDDYDLSRIHFVGQLAPAHLRHVLSLSDLHVYLTVPFVASWSLLNAMACGCTVLGSDTAPVREFITHGDTGLLAGFLDVEALTDTALRVLGDPAAYRDLGVAAVRRIASRYSLDAVLPQMLALYDRALRRHSSRTAIPGPVSQPA
jgi:glycosyltransferase involved in cell wall biosynthesis